MVRIDVTLNVTLADSAAFTRENATTDEENWRPEGDKQHLEMHVCAVNLQLPAEGCEWTTMASFSTGGPCVEEHQDRNR